MPTKAITHFRFLFAYRQVAQPFMAVFVPLSIVSFFRRAFIQA